MAYTPCGGSIAANIAMNCSTPLAAGFTGRAIAIPLSLNPTLSVDAQNPRILKGVTLAEGQHVIAIDNVFTAPFGGSTTTGNADNGRTRYDKLFAVQIPLRGAGVSKDLIEPLVKSAEGFLVIAEKRDRVGDGSYEVFGLQEAMKVDPATVTRDESANGAAWLATFGCSEDFAECTFFTTDYATTKTAFDALLEKAF